MVNSLFVLVPFSPETGIQRCLQGCGLIRPLLLLGLLAILAALAVWVSKEGMPADRVGVVVASAEAEVARSPIAVEPSPLSPGIVRVEPAGAVAPAVVAEARSRLPIGSLQGVHKASFHRLNDVLKKAGRQVLSEECSVTSDDLENLSAMIEVCDKAINDAADSVMALHRPHTKKMHRDIRAAAEAGKEIPYPVLPGGVLPDRGPYDLLITTCYKGVVYVHTIEKTKELLDTVDMQRRAERDRVDSFTQFAELVRRRSR